MSWIYLLDTHLVVFYHSPPQFRIFEAHFGLPQNDPIFDAVDQSEITYTTHVTKSQTRPPTLQSVVQYLMADKPIRSDVPEIRVDTLFAHFLILSGELVNLSLVHIISRVLTRGSPTLHVVQPSGARNVHKQPRCFENNRSRVGQMENIMGSIPILVP